MSLTAAEKIKVRQILRPSPERSPELTDLLTWLVDADAINAVRAAFTRWDALIVSNSPDRAGMKIADVIEWDTIERCHKLHQLSSDIKTDLAIAIGYTLDSPEILAF